MARCNPRSHVLALRESTCNREVIRHHRNELAGTATGYKKDGCRCCDCKLWNTNRSRKERGMQPLPTQQSPERAADGTNHGSATVTPERTAKPATVARKPVQKTMPEAERLAREDMRVALELLRNGQEACRFTEDVTGELATLSALIDAHNVSKRTPVLEYGTDEHGYWVAIEDEPAEAPVARFNLPALVIPAVTSHASPVQPATVNAPVNAPARKVTYELRDNSRGFCHVWVNNECCNIIADGTYLVKASANARPHPACHNHYSMVQRDYPERTSYRNTFGDYVTANQGRNITNKSNRSPWGQKG